jgi:hypothetical protein
LVGCPISTREDAKVFIWESLVLTHLTSLEGLFVRPQFDIAWDKDAREGGSCPDFVAIDPIRPGLILIVEVSTAWDLSGLSERFRNRKVNWYDPLGRNLSIWGHVSGYTFRSIAYVRKDASRFICSGEDVERRNLEDIAFPWQS